MSLSLGSFPFSRTELNGDSTALSGSTESTRWSEHGVTSREKEAPTTRASGHKRMVLMVWHVQTDSVARRIPLVDSSDLRLGLLEREEWRKSARVPHPELPSI
jgi:hypothetical protein